MIPVQPIIFYCFASLLVLASALVIIAKNPVRGALALVLAFFASSVLWIMLEAEFLALVLIFVYVGAVMTLFLFVVMMLNLDLVPKREGFVRYLPFAVIMMVVMIGLLLYVFEPVHFSIAAKTLPAEHAAGYSNVKELGNVLYTQYMYPFELAAIILLVAILAAISLAYRGRQNSKGQVIKQQLSARKQDRLRVIDLKAE